MSKLEVRSLERSLRGAVIAGKLERAEEKGFREWHDKGFKEGKESTEKRFISKLLEKYTTKEISEEFEIPHQRIVEIKEDLIRTLNDKLLKISRQ